MKQKHPAHDPKPTSALSYYLQRQREYAHACGGYLGIGEADDTYNALSEDSADNTLTDLDVSSAMDINIVGDNDINMLDSLDDFDNLDSDEINSSEE